MTANYFYCYHDTPIGQLLLAGTDQYLDLLCFPSGKMAQQPAEDWQQNAQSFSPHRKQLDEYFAGVRTSFDCKFKLAGTKFMQRVLQAVATIPFGNTVAYSTIAAQIGNPKAVRAVGMANARNNVPILVPCHRVIAKDGALTGFGGGIELKQLLLEFEKEPQYGFSLRQRIAFHSI